MSRNHHLLQKEITLQQQKSRLVIKRFIIIYEEHSKWNLASDRSDCDKELFINLYSTM